MGKASRGDAGERTPSGVLRAIAGEAIAACDAGKALRRALGAGPESLMVGGRPLRTTPPGRIRVLALGKAAVPMYDALTARLASAGVRRKVAGLVIAPQGAARPVPPAAPASPATPGGAGMRRGRPAARLPISTTFIASEHPVPGAAAFRAGRTALRFMTATRSGDDVIVLLSGGGSALMALPLAPYLSAGEKARLHRLLVVSGAPIGAINTVRRHLSAVKGGRLAAAARLARSITTLVVCDVDPDRVADVASGPSVPDPTTIDDLVAVIDRYGLAPALPVRVLEGLRTGRLPETPKPGDPAFRRARAEVLLANSHLRSAAVRAGLTRGLAAESMLNEVTGTVEEAVEMAARAIEGAPTGLRLLVLGGEVRTAPAAPGAGGRAQEFALRLALRMRNLSMRGWAFLAAGSDGQDGNSPAAGAFVDATTLDRAAARRLDPERAIARAETWRFFDRLGDALVTGPTRTNVRDLYLLITGLPRPAPAAPSPTPAPAGGAPARSRPGDAPARGSNAAPGRSRRTSARPGRRRR